MNIIAVTACISGVAHTYMAAELLEKFCKKNEIQIEVETQGALGSEHILSEKQIQNADVAVIIADINIEGAERFGQIRQIRSNISTFLRQPEELFMHLDKAYRSPPGTIIQL
ncbi:PTS fructose transporter subunit IIB [Vibrio sp. HA2012]|uniref:fructose PTS transporter subunit IIB n=1 Tax=Vibrio sp. HA2012 TaxID=1971595 RepID=UPI000C2BC217|nr:fructose PTS transporter subunit IIB [Vibrio sp. HA2012]PJC85032.1 PTS fructose transporter subunit IIB [Vibrio sp. HA2012]